MELRLIIKLKLSLLQAYNVIENYDVICLSETFLDSSNENDENLSINGHDMFRCNSPNNSKRGGVCIYFKESLPFSKRDGLSSLDECLVCELKFGKAKCFITSLYRSSSQSKEEFRKFEISLEATCNKISNENPMCSIYLADFNSKNQCWYSSDKTNKF